MNVHADAGVSAQRNGTPERQMLCKITESFLASAIAVKHLDVRACIAGQQCLDNRQYRHHASPSRKSYEVSAFTHVCPLKCI